MSTYLCNCLMSLSLILILGLTSVSVAQPSIKVNSSTIYGVETQVDNKTVHAYLGIRFGKPPVGNLRFSKPELASLPDVVNAIQHGSPCPSLTSVQSEDCLFLNIYVPVPSNSTNSSLPVMVWIHGGGFIFSSSNEFNGSRLAAEGEVIVVTFNYRLGPFGFLSTGDNSSLGNYGLWDQRLALEWVRDNIQPFGGNASLITVIGESAGGASASYQVTSPQSSGLFQRAILQSGCQLCPWAYNATYRPQDVAKQLATALQCNTSDGDSDRMITCLRGKNFTDVQTASSRISGWVPVVDGDFVLRYDLDQHQKFSGPIMSGLNNREGGVVFWLLQKLNSTALTSRTFYREVALTLMLDQVHHSLKSTAGAKAVDDAKDLLDCVYRDETSTDSIVSQTELESIGSDAYFFVCTQQFLDSQPSTGNVFRYHFNHYPKIPGAEKGMNHGMDLFYTFGFDGGVIDLTSPFNGQNIPSEDLALAVRFRSLLTNFAKTGNPNQGAELSGWPEWLPYTKEGKSYLDLTSSPRVSSHLKKDKMTIWLQTIPSLLKSEGPAKLSDTPWSRKCQGPIGSANSNFVSKIYIMFSLLVTAMALLL